MSMEIREDVLVAFEFKILAADFYSDDFLICQGRAKAAALQPTLLPDDTVLLANKQKNSDNKTVSIHWRTPCEQGLDTAILQDAPNGSGIFFKSCTLGYNIFVKEQIKGDVILLSGFGKYGTYELSRMLSKINRPILRKSDKLNQKENIFVNDCKKFITAEKLFKEINAIRKEDNYCIETIFDFTQEYPGNICKNCKGLNRN